MNLVRDPANGRNFEYLGEDPLLAGTLAGASIGGIQSRHVLSTTKHFILNAQETGRKILNARIDMPALRESDLLAFEIAIEKGSPGSVMCSYNRINGPYACQSRTMMTDVLKGDWGWKGWVMSDWGAVGSFDTLNAGLDQQSGAARDKEVYLDGPLRAALKDGTVTQARFDDMVHRILRSLFAKGLVDDQKSLGPLDTRADGAVAQRAAEAGLVLLKNEGGLLPLTAKARTIAVIGTHADIGVLSGGGSAQVIPQGSLSVKPAGAPETGPGSNTRIVYHPSSPLETIRARSGGATVSFDDGGDPAKAAALARSADVVLVFAGQWTAEGADTPPSLGAAQDRLIEAVAAANPHTVVVLQTGAQVLMPWLDRVPAVVEAWYPGSRGAQAITRLLYGDIDAEGRLPVTFPAALSQLPRAEPPAGPVSNDNGKVIPLPYDVDYREGSSVGYRWFAEKGEQPRFPFGFGLSYTRFGYTAATFTGGRTVKVGLLVSNTGRRAGVDTVQLYLKQGPKRAQQRLLGWAKVALKPGQSRRVTISADPRLLADWDETAHGWRVAGGSYRVFVGSDAATATIPQQVRVAPAVLRP